MQENISTGFKELDKLVNLSKPQVIMIVGRGRDHQELSGDIANNICLKQGLEVLEIVNSRKEYLIQRMFVNEANVNYRDWYQKNKYTDEELKRIGQSTVNIIDSLQKLPIIIEEEWLWPRRKKIKEIVRDFAEDFGDHYPLLAGIIVLDLFEMNSFITSEEEKLKGYKKKNEKEEQKIIKDMKEISKKTNCPIIITKHFNNHNKKIKIEEMRNHKIIKKYVDTFIITDTSSEGYEYNNIEVFGKNGLIGKIKLAYNIEIRKYEETKGEII